MALADEEFRKNEAWKVEITHTLMRVSLIFRETAGVRFRIKAYDYWTPGPGVSGSPGGGASRPLDSLLSALRTRLKLRGRGSGDIVIGLIPEEPGEPGMGLADYLNGIVLMKYVPERNTMSYVLLHELCHLFGAVDLLPPRFVMSRKNPSFLFDGFTKAILRINQQRSFRTDECPLPKDRILQAIALYAQSQSLGLDESELAICLRELRSMLHERGLAPR